MEFPAVHAGIRRRHCIGVDPYYLTARAEAAGYYPQVILSGRRINDGMGGFIAQRLVKLLIAAERPSRIEHELHLIQIETVRTLRFADLESLVSLGVEIARYRTFEYQATQAIAAAAYFLEFDSLIVPSARFACANLVIFTERATGLTLKNSQAVDWESWRRSRVRR